MTFPKTKIWKCHFFCVPLHSKSGNNLLRFQTGLQAKSEASQGNFRGASDVS